MRRGLYAIVDADALAGRDPLSFAERLLAAGPLFALQLRAKAWPARAVLETARALAHRCKRAGVPFYVNDRADLALLAGADGVHVGQDDLTVEQARAIAPGLRVGLSTHDLAQLERGLAAAPDYLAWGPVFATGSKHNPDPVVGLDGLARAVARVAGAMPVVAIGGITLERAEVVRAAGASAGAVIAALAAAGGDDAVTERARGLHRALGGAEG